MRVCLLIVALVAVGCGDDTTSSNTQQDLSMSGGGGGDMEIYSLCGHPGDTGNSKGVGEYCMDSSMCNRGMASVCSTLMPIQQGPVYFCTFPCTVGTTDCGESATCTCLSANNPNLCGCVPDVCRVGLFG